MKSSMVCLHKRLLFLNRDSSILRLVRIFVLNPFKSFERFTSATLPIRVFWIIQHFWPTANWHILQDRLASVIRAPGKPILRSRLGRLHLARSPRLSRSRSFRWVQQFVFGHMEFMDGLHTCVLGMIHFHYWWIQDLDPATPCLLLSVITIVQIEWAIRHAQHMVAPSILNSNRLDAWTISKARFQMCHLTPYTRAYSIVPILWAIWYLILSPITQFQFQYTPSTASPDKT